MNFKTRMIAVAAVALAVAGTFGIAGPALASPVERAGSTTDTTTQVTLPMTFGGFDATRAAQYGYDIRTDSQGWQYAVPTGTPAGSTVGSSLKYNPATGQVMQPTSTGHFAKPMNTVPSDCGTATLTIYDRTSGYTAYNLNGSVGGSVYHTWRISMSAPTGSQIVNRDGLPPFPGALNWGTTFTYGVHAGPGTLINGVVSTGIVETTLGRCYAQGPSDSYYY